MSPTDVVVVLVVAALFALCVRSIVRGNKAGECADCSMGGSCSGHAGGSCELSDDIVSNAEAAVRRLEATRAKK